MKFTLPTLASLFAAGVCAANNSDVVFLPIPKGRWATDIQALELIDHSRIDPYSPTGGPRKLMVSVFTPTILAEECKHPQAYRYAPPKTAELIAPLLEVYGWLNSTQYLDRLRLPVCPAAREHWGETRKKEELPVVLFSHGLGTTRLASSSQAQAVAAQGFVVITIDHPYDADVVEYPDGSILKARTFATVQELDADVQVRSKDASFVVDELHRLGSPLHRSCGFGEQASPKVAMFGHSLGGASSVRAAYDDSRILGALDLDGSPYGFNTTVTGTNSSDQVFVLPKMPSPFLLFNEPSFVHIIGMPELYAAFTGYKRQLALEGSFHLTFTDLPLLVDTFGLRGALPPAFEEYSGTIGGERARDVVAAYVGNFMGRVLKGERGVLLEGESEEFGEVEFVQSQG